MKTKYGIISGYHSIFVKEIHFEDGKFKPLSYCKNIEEIPCLTKKEAINICNKLNASDYFAQASGENMFCVIKLQQITK